VDDTGAPVFRRDEEHERGDKGSGQAARERTHGAGSSAVDGAGVGRWLAAEQGVSRKFVYAQAELASVALDRRSHRRPTMASGR
jgi:hypothetical protein